MSIIDKLDNILTSFENKLFWVVIVWTPLYFGIHLVWFLSRNNNACF